MSSAVSLSPAEKKSIENVLTQRREEGRLISKVTPINEKKNKKKGDMTLILGINRLYLFKASGKVQEDLHYLDITEIQSPTSHEITIKFRSGHHIKFQSADTDVILKNLYTALVTSFPAITIGKALIFSLNPESRLVTIFSAASMNKDVGACGSFATTYKSVCDYMNIQPLSSVLWDIENMYPFNSIKEFNLNEIYQYGPSDLRALITSFAYNNYFTSFVANNCKLSNEETNQLAESLKMNTTMQKLCLNNVQSSKESLMAVLSSATENKAIKLQHLNLGNNYLDSKGLASLGTTVQSFPTGISYLNVENTGGGGKAMEALFNSIMTSASASTLTFLSISNNKLEAAGTAALCKLLHKAAQLNTLQMSNTSPVYGQLRSGCTPLKVLDFSGNKPSSSKETMMELLGFFRQLPQLTHINLSRLGLSGDDLKLIFSPATSLLKVPNVDLSDNDLGDAGLLKLCEVMYPNSNLRHLAIDNNLKSRSKLRVRAIEALCNLIEDNVGIESLSVASISKGLKGDLVPLVMTLLKNESLVKLDISGNGIGDHGALVLSKVLWKNKTLKSVKIDGNDFSAGALKIIEQALKRNPSPATLVYLPIMDVNAMLLADKSAPSHDMIHKTLVDIQNIVSNSAQAQMPAAVDGVSPMKLVGLGSGGSGGSASSLTIGRRSIGSTSPVSASTKPAAKPAPIDGMNAKRPAIRGPLYPGRQIQTSAETFSKGASTTVEIPPIVSRSVDFLVANGTKVVGIFRTCASATLLKKIKARFEAGEDLDLVAENIDPDTVAGVLKSYFRELPVPIFPETIHERFFQASRMPTNEEKAAAYREVIEQLPALENKMSKRLFHLLHLISLEKSENMMSPENLAICWAPTLFRSFSSELLPINSFLVVNYYEIFDPENAPVKANTNGAATTPSEESPQSANEEPLPGSPPSDVHGEEIPMDGTATLRGKRFTRAKSTYSPVIGRRTIRERDSQGWTESSRTLSSLFQDEWQPETSNNNSPPS
ncbi:hypothetical protein SAMD00019534_102850 [Acytostelium subglobosum LB1]|uniref:hypothetical protein n=1 Tax=Acytostelium subglobosum LB1 TaxID=1410327 RepID=UPI000644B235|nr:hypothetical protein SAMD00019534_102850 [Acytostelium subglobosum LB1]GAM27110.1 hypothetical protein SAMD00019534_102850 [Acytostelium subglobosum LB1]|eukprot:XP_012749990.1 hypothetical protein SAMD00019534_102850 [Acytostelium subglobosum LB1]